jgi:hypothetical protein
MREQIEAKIKELERVEDTEWELMKAAEENLNLEKLNAEMKQHADAWYECRKKLTGLRVLLASLPEAK